MMTAGIIAANRTGKAGGGETILLSDDFAYADGALPTVSAAAWYVNGGWQMVDVASGTVVSAGTATEGLSVYQTATGVTDYAVRATVTGGGSYSEGGVIGRKAVPANANKDYYAAILGSDLTFKLYAVAGGAYNQIGSTYVPASASGVVMLRMVGDSISAWLDGVQRVAVTDTTHTNGQYTGLENYRNTGVSAVVDTWQVLAV